MNVSHSQTTELQDRHNAAWSRYHAAESRIKAGDHSPAAQREYEEAGKAVTETRNEQAGRVYTGRL